jgi:predicted amidophosphoribosyltransferase
MLALAVGRLTGVPVDCSVLKRGAPDGKPGRAHCRAAARNVRGAFKVDQKLRPRIKGKELVLVDDVITTGATAEACARALKRAGATSGGCSGAGARGRAGCLRALALALNGLSAQLPRGETLVFQATTT